MKITLSRQGLAQDGGSGFDQPKSAPHQKLPIRIAFFGRLDPTKGIHILIQAVWKVPNLPIVLDIYGIEQDRSDEPYVHRLKKLAADDPRITFYASLPADQVVIRLQNYDLLAVPSQWLETGPLVVLEAFAAEIPVLGSNLGGIAELVQHEVNGLLVEPHSSVEAWCKALQRISEDPRLLSKLRPGIRSPRRMETVAGEMKALYDELV